MDNGIYKDWEKFSTSIVKKLLLVLRVGNKSSAMLIVHRWEVLIYGIRFKEYFKI